MCAENAGFRSEMAGGERRRAYKYLNNILEQDRRFIKRITGRMLGFKAFHSASATLDGIEVAHMIRKGQFNADNLNAFQQFAQLAA